MLIDDMLKLPFVVVLAVAILAILLGWATAKAPESKKIRMFLILVVVVLVALATGNAINFVTYGQHLDLVAKMYPAFQGKSCLYGDKGMACYDTIACDFRKVEHFSFDTENRFDLKTKFLVQNVQGLVVVDGLKHLDTGIYPVVRATVVGRTDFIISQYACPEPIYIPEYNLISDLKMGIGLWFGTFFWASMMLMLISFFTFLWLHFKQPWLWTERVFALVLTVVFLVTMVGSLVGFNWFTLGKFF